MFKKIEVWVLYLVVMGLLMFCLLFGFLVRQELVGSNKVGVFSKSALFLAEIPVTLTVIKKRFETGEKGDMQVPDRFPGKAGFDGKPLDYPSYLLLSRYDGNISQSIVELVDLTNFDSVYKWIIPIEEINERVDVSYPEYENQRVYASKARFRASHSLLADDGGLYVHAPFTKIDSCGTIEFINQEDFYHHSLNFDENGDVWVPSHKFPSDLPSSLVGDNYKDFLDDSINKINSKGEVLYTKSVTELLIENGEIGRVFLAGNEEFGNDPIHLNDIQPVLKDTKYWKAGDVFLSLRSLSLVILYRPSENKVIWKSDGLLAGQHDVDIVSDSKISIFNNNMIRSIESFENYGKNEVIVYDFSTNEYSSYLKDSLAENDVRTVSEGLQEIAANGDMFLEETNYGRSLLFGGNGDLRWTYYNRADDGNMYRTNWSRFYSDPEDIARIENIIDKLPIEKGCS